MSSEPSTEEANENAALSQLLWDAREIAAMYGDVVAGRAGQRSAYVDRVRDRIDTYRAVRGWNAYGFGGES